MGLFGSSKIDGYELQQCLAYFEAQTKVIAFQTKEADIYNNAMVKYGNSIMGNPVAASEARKAAKRLSQAATEVLRRHEELKNVPTAASAMHHAWYATLYANAAWASATAKAVEVMAEGMNPNTIYIQQLVKEYKKAWRRAEDEDKKFLKQLKVSAEDIAKIVARATAIDATNDDWEPKSETAGN
jgi:protein involved in sex pheromone biosynthesis